MNNAIRKWQRKRRNKKKLAYIAEQIMRQHTLSFHNELLTRDFARKLAAIDMAAAERLPGFLESASVQSIAVKAAFGIVEEKEEAAAILRVLMNHFEYLVASKPGINGFAGAASRELVKTHRIHEWRLPLQRERDVVDVIVSTTVKGTRVEPWVVPFMVNHPDKTEQVKEMLVKRKVNTLHDMEALLEDDVPMVIQDGAL